MTYISHHSYSGRLCLVVITGLLGLSGCTGEGDLTGALPAPDGGGPAVQTPDAGSNTQLNPPTGTTAECAVDWQTTPPGVPAQALYRAADEVLGRGGSLNQFWGLDTCVFACDKDQYPNVARNAISFSQGTVIYDPGLFQEFNQRFGSNSGTLFFTAHEWGHQVQFHSGAFSGATSAQMEADADVRAGYFLGSVAQQDGSADVSQIANLFGQLACATGGSDTPTYFDPYAHGSCQTRMNNLIAGFNQAMRDSPLGRGQRANPALPAQTSGSWAGQLVVKISVVDDSGVVASDSAPFDYWFVIGSDGRILDDMGTGPMPELGQQKFTPVRTDELDLDIVATTTAFSFDDSASRYEMSLEVARGAVTGIPVTGTGYETDVFTILPDGRINIYVFDLLTLTADNGNSVTLVLESTGSATAQ